VKRKLDITVRMWCSACVKATRSKDCPYCDMQFQACAECGLCPVHGTGPISDDEDGWEDS
jgi:hypothetical protein